ncbi:MAG: HNH endonuclease, partial [Clostridia bacterium]|nr:HNH endonuclease [Clostridia bacterium]
AFSEDIKIKAMVACGRRCCICHKFCGNNMELHHIKARADGGEDIFQNAIPLCFDCHAVVRQYDPRHPKGIKFTAKELTIHRNLWYKKIEQGIIDNLYKGAQKEAEAVKVLHQKDYQNIMLCKANEGKEIISCMQGACGISYDEETQTLEEVKLVGDFIQYIREMLDMYDLLDEPSERIMVAFNLTQSIKELEKAGFFVFVGIENQRLTGGVGNSENFPVLLLRIVRKDSEEIIK